MCRTVLELEVRNHPGVICHIAGLISRRGFNVEGMLCGPPDSDGRSRVFLLLGAGERVQQLLKQLVRLQDVRFVRPRKDCHADLFLLPGAEELSLEEGAGGA